MAPKRDGHELHLNRAKAHLKAGRYDEAREACRAALAAAPGHADALALAARIERERGVAASQRPYACAACSSRHDRRAGFADRQRAAISASQWAG